MKCTRRGRRTDERAVDQNRATGAHLHGPAVPGATAGIQFTMGGLSLTAAGVHVQTFTGISAAQETDLLADMYYVNIHTALNSTGEIRGQADSAILVPVELSAFGLE